MSLTIRPTDQVSRIGRFTVEEEVSRNATGVLYRGLHPGLRLPVAIKVFTSSVTRDPAFAARFRRETAAIATLAHPNILRVYDMVEHDGSLCVVTEYFPGRTLRALLGDRRRFQLGEALGLLEPVMDAVGAVHTRGIVHGHLKAENILLGPGGQVRVVDFGISHLLHESGNAAGSAKLVHTGAYLAPEQVLGQSASTASDLYSIGVLLYELLDGQPPFRGSLPTVLHAHLHQAPSPSAYIPRELWPALQKALAKEPGERFRSCAEFTAQLRPSGPVYRPGVSPLPAFGA